MRDFEYCWNNTNTLNGSCDYLFGARIGSIKINMFA